MKRRARISWSASALPGGSQALCFHWAQRDEFEKEPSFSAKIAAGRRKTSVWLGSIVTFQKSAVSVSKASAMTHQSSFASAAIIFSVFGPFATGFMPKSMKPLIFPAYMLSNR